MVAEGPRSSAAELSNVLTVRLIAACEAEGKADLAPILALLRRFAAESAREAARGFVEDAAVAAPAPLDLPEAEAATTLAGLAIEGVNENFALEPEPEDGPGGAIAHAA